MLRYSQDIPGALNRESSAEKFVQAASVLPILRRLEKEAIGENSERMLQEAETGVSAEKIKLTSDMLKRIDAEMIKSNSNCEGNIVWLKRSRCNDPNWLEKAPDVLPNPKRWREILQQSEADESDKANSNISLVTGEPASNSEIQEARKRKNNHSVCNY